MQKRVGLLVCFFLLHGNLRILFESAKALQELRTDNQGEYHLRGGPRT